MCPVETISVPGSLLGVRQAMQAFERFGRMHGLPAGAEWRVLLALDEILSNIVRHGAAAGNPGIDVTFALGDGSVQVEVMDSAEPFNPLLAPPPDTHSPLDDRRPGGLGIALVRQLMDETRYERRGSRNHFVMRCGRHADQ